MIEFESALERDFIILLEFDSAVAGYEAQPLYVEYRKGGRRCRGVPDFLVRYHEVAGRPPLLCDVKYRQELFEGWSELKPRLRAAMALAKSHGWSYRIMSEVEIRTPRLANAKFLLAYRPESVDPLFRTLLLQKLSGGPMCPRKLLDTFGFDRLQRARALSDLWALIAQGAIRADLQQPLTMQSLLWVA